MFAGSKAVWYLPLCVVAGLVFLYVSFVSETSHFVRRSESVYPDTLRMILSPRTLHALDQDQQFQDAVLSFTHAIAETSTNLGERFHFEHLKTFGIDLSNGVDNIRAKQHRAVQKRGIIDDIGSAFQGIFGGGGKPGGLNLTGGLEGLFGGIGDKLVGSLATPALFLGIGLGMGASSGLNMTDPATAKDQAVKVANAYNASATGLNLVAQNLGSGLAGQIAPSLGSSSNISFGLIAFALASGIGNATAFGLNLTQEQALPSNGSNLEAVAGNLGLGITTPIVSKIDFQGLMKNFGGSGSSKLMEQLPQIAAAAGKGLGEGARDGLGLAKTPAARRRRRQQAASSNDPLANLDIPGTVGSFTKGLSQSFLTGSDLSKLNIGSNLSGSFDIQKMLRPLAAGAGAGIGMGVAVGLNLRSKDAQPAYGNNISAEDEKTAVVAEVFIQNLISNILTNSTALQKGKELLTSNQPSLLKDVNAGKAAEGFARGAIEGIASAMSSVGGLKNLISGNISSDALKSVPILEPSQFDDSTNGAAIGLARGLTGPGTIVVAEVIRNFTGGMNNVTAPSAPKEKRSDNGAIVDSLKALTIRQNPSDSTPAPLAFDSSMLSSGAQVGVDFLTCRGLGGVAAAGLAIIDSGKLKGSSLGGKSPLDSSVLKSLPEEPIKIVSEGNNFQISLRDMKIEVNGMPVRKYMIITICHVVFAGLAFLLILPMYLVWGVIWRVSVASGYPINEAKNKWWRMAFLILFFLLGAGGIILGIIGMGNGKHFQDTHGIIGLICLIFIIPAVVLAGIRLRTAVPHPSPASFSPKGAIALLRSPQKIYLFSSTLITLLLLLGQFTTIQGFSALRSTTLCLADAVLTSAITAIITSVMLMLQISATALLTLRIWLERHIASRDPAAAIEVELSKPKARGSSIKTFGFDNKNIPASAQATRRPPPIARRTASLKGMEDMQISTPFNVRKEGGGGSPLDPEDRWYNPKTTGYIEGNTGGPKTENVSTEDLFPPPLPEHPAFRKEVGRVGEVRRDRPNVTNVPRVFGGDKGVTKLG